MNHVALENIQRQLQALPVELDHALRGWYNQSMEEGRLLDLSNHIDQTVSEQPESVIERHLPVQNSTRDPKRSTKPKWESSASANSPHGGTQYVYQKEQYVYRKEQYGKGYRACGDLTCSSGCSCICHTSNKAKSYSVSSFISGSIFIGFRTSTSATRSCNDQRCYSARRTITYTYTFPSWLLYHAITATISNAHSSGPEFNLRLMNVVDRRNRENVLFGIMEWPENKIISELKRQLDTGEASVLDMDTFGTSSVLVCTDLSLLLGVLI